MYEGYSGSQNCMEKKWKVICLQGRNSHPATSEESVKSKSIWMGSSFRCGTMKDANFAQMISPYSSDAHLTNRETHRNNLS